MMNDPIFNIELHTTCMDTHLSNALNPFSLAARQQPPALHLKTTCDHGASIHSPNHA